MHDFKKLVNFYTSNLNKNMYFQKMARKFHIVLEAKHFLSFLPNLNKKGMCFFIIHFLSYCQKFFFFLIYSKDVSKNHLVFPD